MHTQRTQSESLYVLCTTRSEQRTAGELGQASMHTLVDQVRERESEARSAAHSTLRYTLQGVYNVHAFAFPS